MIFFHDSSSMMVWVDVIDGYHFDVLFYFFLFITFSKQKCLFKIGGGRKSGLYFKIDKYLHEYNSIQNRVIMPHDFRRYWGNQWEYIIMPV